MQNQKLKFHKVTFSDEFFGLQVRQIGMGVGKMIVQFLEGGSECKWQRISFEGDGECENTRHYSEYEEQSIQFLNRLGIDDVIWFIGVF